ncbi:hypothetical protein [Carboxylicivirga sp. N1Y90]|uniref:hypothetical protein n=1 Tax=Carboxylicivirga fragile TaxID=3417571 RepID=UPI003D324972|nr:hypothetical protein [Marinilabiliaceae bacterium N1Y90]
MTKLKINPVLVFLLIILVASITSCQYDFVEIDLPDESIPVSFSEEILPIFSKNNCTECHNSNSSLVDLSPDKAYDSIVPDLIDENDPANSKIYLYPNPSYSDHQYKKYAPIEAALVLNWITQGAKDN